MLLRVIEMDVISSPWSIEPVCAIKLPNRLGEDIGKRDFIVGGYFIDKAAERLPCGFSGD
jgi:hypothetical protein